MILMAQGEQATGAHPMSEDLKMAHRLENCQGQRVVSSTVTGKKNLHSKRTEMF